MRMHKFCRILGTLLIFNLGNTHVMAIEEPNYEVVKEWENASIQIRAYSPRVMAVTEIDEGKNNGFRILAGYIFGRNTREQKIEMTAPVQQTMDGPPEMAFMMPSEYSLPDLPTPNDKRVTFREAPAFTAAVIRFNGWADLQKAEERWQKLKTFLVNQNIQIIGQPTLNQYNPPWTLPFLRRNEIIVPVREMLSST